MMQKVEDNRVEVVAPDGVRVWRRVVGWEQDTPESRPFKGGFSLAPSRPIPHHSSNERVLYEMDGTIRIIRISL